VETGRLNAAPESISRVFIVEKSYKSKVLQHIFLNCGDSKDSVDTFVANVAKFGFDSTVVGYTIFLTIDIFIVLGGMSLDRPTLLN
jgi:hypothetical protein